MFNRIGWPKVVPVFIFAVIACVMLALVGNTVVSARHLLASRQRVLTRQTPMVRRPAGTLFRPTEFASRTVRTLAQDLPATRQAGRFSAQAAIFENPAQGLALTVTRAGTRLRLARGATLDIRLVAARTGGRFLRLTGGTPVAGGSRIEVPRADGLMEWFVNTPRGIEQGFTFEHPPAGSGNSTELRFALDGRLTPELDHNTLRFADGAHRAVLRYGDLVAYDAHHRRLPARMSLRGRMLSLSVDTRGAAYPIVIDPLFSASGVFNEPTPVAGDLFGYAVAISSDGNTALVGTPGAAKAYVFTYGSTGWTAVATLPDPGASASDGFGQAVALSADGTEALIGAPGADKAYLFGSSNGIWNTTPHGFDDPASTAADQFGNSVALSADGNTVLIGAYEATAYTPPASTKSPAAAAGRAYAYAFAGSSWSPPAVFQAPQPAADDGFGHSVALASGTGGDTALIGAPSTAVPSPTSKSAPPLALAGEAYVYSFSYSSKNGWNTGSPIASITEPGPAANNQFGYAVSLSSDGTHGLIGAPYAGVVPAGTTHAVATAGKAYLYTGSSWSNPVEFDDPDATGASAGGSAENGNFGASVALAADNSGAVIGAPGASVSVPSGSTNAPPAIVTDAGKVFAYSRLGGSWPPQSTSLAVPQPISDPGKAANDRFGSSVTSAAFGGSSIPAVDGLAGGPYISVKPPAAQTLATAGSVLAFYTADDLSLALSAASSVLPGGSLTYNLTVTNNDADIPASSLVVTDALPVGFSFSTSSGGCSHSAGTATVTCSRSSLAPQATWQPTITVTAPSSPTRISNQASVSGALPDPVNSNNSASVSVLVDQAPTANTSSITVHASASDALSATTYYPAQQLTYSITQQPADGTVTLTNASTGTYTYTVNPASLGAGGTASDSFGFQVNDGFLNSNTAQVSVTAYGPPTASTPAQAISVHGPYTCSNSSCELAGSDPDKSQTLTYKISPPGASHGQVKITSQSNAGAFYTYTPNAGYKGPDEFSFTVKDGYNTSAPATVNLQVYTPPTVSDTSLVVHNGSGQGTLTGSDSDGLQVLYYTVVSGPSHGTVHLTQPITPGEAATYTYAVAAGYTGSTDSFTFQANDSYHTTNTATASIVIYAPPVAHDGKLTAHVNAAGSVTATDSDPSQKLTYTVTTFPGHGQLATFNSSTGAFTYQANPGYTGADSFQFNANDSYATSNTATVSITDFAAPTASNGSLIVHAAGSGQLVATDPDSSQALTYSLAKQPSHGVVTLNGATGAYIYRADAGYSGTDSFTFNARDSYNSSNAGTIKVTAYAAPTANKATLIAHVAASAVLSASDPDSTQSLTYKVVQPPLHGTVKLDAGTGAYTYSGNAGYTGNDSFTFSASDHYSSSNAATVSVTVFAVPTAANATLAVHGSASGQLQATEPDNKQTLTYVLVSSPAHGKVALDAGTGAYTYTADAGFTGEDSFTFEVRDSFNTSNIATLKVNVYGPPTASDAALTAATNRTASGQLKATDPDPSQTLAYVVVSPPAHGALSLDGATGGFIYRPIAGYSGSDGFTYAAKDAYASSNTAAVTITVAATSSPGGNSNASGPPAPVSPGGGGALGWLSVLLLIGMADLRRRRN